MENLSFPVSHKKTQRKCSYILTINAPINLTAPCIIFSGGFFFITRGIGPMNQDFFGASERLVRFGAQKSRDSWAQSPEY